MAELIDRNSLLANLNKFAPEHFNALVNDLIKKEPIATTEAEIRAKAIDEFAEKLMEEQIIGCMLPDGFRTDVVTSHTIDTIAEQLKEE